jgi:hypothetical protein
MTQPEALRLADELDRQYLHACEPAAAELRRLHAENEVMRNVANRGGHIAVAMSRIADLVAQRDALLEALKRVLDRFNPYAVPGYETNVAAEEKARAAIKAVEETK